MNCTKLTRIHQTQPKEAIMIDARFRRLQNELSKISDSCRRNEADLHHLIVANKAAPPDLEECEPNSLYQIRCDIVDNIALLRHRRNIGVPVRTMTVSGLATIVAATPPGEAISEYVHRRVTDYWNACWPEPWGHLEQRNVDQKLQYFNLFILAALGSPTADQLRREIAAMPPRYVTLKRRDPWYGFTNFAFDDTLSYLSDDGNHLYFFDENGRKHLADVPHPAAERSRASGSGSPNDKLRALIATL